MKKFILPIIITIISFQNLQACDICGCGVGSNYIGILPDFTKKIAGFRYRYNSMLTHIGVGGIQSYLSKEEFYRTLELYGGWNIGKKFRVMAAIPYSFNQSNNQGITREKNGLGDISFTGFYQLVNSKKILRNKLLVQSLFIGAGIKLPTGKYNPADKQSTNQNANLFQLGTASLDYSMNAMYDIRLQDIGLNVNASYKLNTANRYNYSYGNKLSTTAQLYYKYRIKNRLLLAPNAGFLFEHSSTDIDNHFKVDMSGGNISCLSLGMEAGVKKVAIGFNWQTPISQNLANGFVKANNRAMLHVSFSF